MERSSVRPFVRLSHPSAACGGFAAERRVGERYRSTAAGARQQRRSAVNAGSVVLTTGVDDAQHTPVISSKRKASPYSITERRFRS